MWRQVPFDAVKLASGAAAATLKIRKAIAKLPPDGFLDIWYSADKQAAHVSFGSWSCPEDQARLRAAVQATTPLAEREEANDWVRIATQPPGVLFQKQAEGRNVLRDLGSLGGHFGDVFGKIPGVPSPVSAALASGLLGAGAGYGTGWVAEKFLPEKWKRNRLRRTLAVLGGLGGAATALPYAAVNVAEHGPSGLLQGGPLDTPPDIHGPFRRYDDQGNLLDKLVTSSYKEAVARYSPLPSYNDTGAFPPPIDAQRLVDTIHSPPVAQQLSPATQAASIGLVLGAGHKQTGGRYMPRMVSPLSVGNMAAGMGSGWLSGVLVGKVLGALTGMPESAQKKLRNTGLWAGAITNILPLAFPGR
jgi:hypothetical protein